ncbi:MAG: hypothetical protein WC757_05035 [Candidatus Paceibacterota bacterium]|jgi:hypothetical protein
MENSIPTQDGKKQWIEIQEKDVDTYKLMGTAGGFSFGFCVYLAHKHALNFFDRVVGYRIEEHGIGEMMNEAAKKTGLPERHWKNITVSFYESKPIN